MKPQLSLYFLETLRIVDYEGIFLKLKKIRFFLNIAQYFPKVQRFNNAVRFRSDLSDRTRSTTLCLLDTFLSKTVAGNFDHLCGLFLARSLSLRVDKTRVN